LQRPHPARVRGGLILVFVIRKKPLPCPSAAISIQQWVLMREMVTLPWLLIWGSFASIVMSGSIVPARTCHPSLPIDWFIRNAQSMPPFSEFWNSSLASASAKLSAIIDSNRFYSSGMEAVSVVVSAPWGIVYEHHVGKLRNNDSSDHRIVNGDSIYRIGSITKVLTVLEVLILQEKGKLSLDDSPLKYFPYLNISPDITIEMLASQMSGLGRDRTVNPLPSDLDLSKYVAGTCGRPGFTCTRQEFFDSIGRYPPVFQPETQPSCILLYPPDSNGNRLK
jgi:hypothetical protein